MQPIDKLLARIKWDKEFGNAAFAIGYYDRAAACRPAFCLSRATGSPFCSWTRRACTSRIPLHRVREVYRNNVLIW